ncbi:LexA family transcriptional regulator [Clostridium aestuarii]|uniref:LexA family transcriptional regulator n=1 Tax=Clostridium aestuarii TaxID=338193 RepID=A0ABT4CV57_9CLOT|nr:LexA family transcriptional regulator [Clostridium aestuarii]MCY6482864.1 LexA family transcriptional regulator [Clostridium aestuarii]
MQANKEQLKLIDSKPSRYSIIKGIEGCGKTTASVYRALYLKNNYSLCQDEKILMIAYSQNHFDYINNIYNRLEKDTKYDYYTLFSSSESKTHIVKLDDIIKEYFNEYNKNNKISYKLIFSDDIKRRIIKQSLPEVKKFYPRMRILKEAYINFFIDEIKWIKSFNYETCEEYKTAQRKGRKCKRGEGPSTLKKNSIAREAIFKLMKIYNEKIKEQGHIDYEDAVLFAIKEAKRKANTKYSHIFIDESENYTKSQIEFIKTLQNERPYSTITFIVDIDKKESLYSAFVRRGRIYSKELGVKIKRYNFKSSYDTLKEKEDSSIEKFEYFDFRHNKRFDMTRDYINLNEIIVNDEDGDMEYKNEELRQIPVFSNIAAGEPILIDTEQQDNFYIPEYWLKGLKKCFILKVKGNSMINANIHDGDYVVVQQQFSANHNDIVAVNLEGSATLKRLHIGKNKVLLMPENEKYDPIPVNEEGIYLIGKAVGVIRKN